MAFISSIVFYSQASVVSPAEVLLACLKASRALKFNVSYNFYEKEIKDTKYLRRVGNEIMATGIGFAEVEGIRPKIDEVYSHNRDVFFELGNAQMAESIHQAVLRDIPPEVYGTHLPVEMSITLGQHRVVHKYFDDLLITANLSIAFWGWDHPIDQPKYAELALQLPAVKAAKAELEKYAGPLEQLVRY